MRILNDTTELVQVTRLQRHPKNPRRGNVDLIRESIEANGFFGAIVAQRSSGHILVGNHRYDAAVADNADAVPVIWVDVDDDRALRILLADNRTNDVAGYDDEALAALLEELRIGAEGLIGTGYDEAAVEELLAGLAPPPGETDPDDVPEVPEEPVTKAGDLYVLGQHRLLCGDATSAEDVARLLDGAEPALMVTDPPYGVDYDPDWRNDAAQAGAKSMGPPTGRAVGRVQNDDTASWPEAWQLFTGAIAYVWHGALNSTVVAADLAAAKLGIRAHIIWAKSHVVINRGHYHWQHEPCWYAVRNGKTAGWIGDRSQSTLWQIDVVKNDTGHGTQKPVECMERPIRNHRGNVYDPFVGTGTTIVAAERARRICYAMDIDPRYCDVAVQRWEAFTGNKAERYGSAKRSD